MYISELSAKKKEKIIIALDNFDFFRSNTGLLHVLLMTLLAFVPEIGFFRHFFPNHFWLGRFGILSEVTKSTSLTTSLHSVRRTYTHWPGSVTSSPFGLYHFVFLMVLTKRTMTFNHLRSFHTNGE